MSLVWYLVDIDGCWVTSRDFNNRNDDKQLIIQTTNSQLPLADGHWSLPKWEWIDYDGSDAVLKEWMICSTWESMLITNCFEVLSDPVIPSFLYDLSSWSFEISTTSTTLLPCCAPARCELCWRLHPTSSRWGPLQWEQVTFELHQAKVFWIGLRSSFLQIPCNYVDLYWLQTARDSATYVVRWIVQEQRQGAQVQHQRRQCPLFGWPPIFQQGRMAWSMGSKGSTFSAEEIGELKKLIQNYMKEENVGASGHGGWGLGHTLRAKSFGADPRVGDRYHPFFGEPSCPKSREHRGASPGV